MRIIPYVVRAVEDDPTENDTSAGRPGQPQRTMFHAQRIDGSQRLEMADFAEVAPGHDVQWLWQGRIPLGHVTLIEGDPGAGKSFVALDLAARVSRGKLWPETAAAGAGSRPRPPGNVLLVLPQDDGSAIGRRLDELGADRSHIRSMRDVASYEPQLERTERRRLMLPYDLPMLRQELDDNESIKLVVIDPLSDLCEGPQTLAETLRQLNELAASKAVAIVVTLPAHCRFDSRGSLRVSSRWRTEAARWVWCVVADPDDPARRMFVPRRTNYCTEPPGLAFRLERGHVVWSPGAQVDPRDPLEQQKGARACLDELLRDGFRPAREIFSLGAQCGFNPRQLRAAAKRDGVESHKGAGFGADGGYLWFTSEQRSQYLAGDCSVVPALEAAPPEAAERASEHLVKESAPFVEGAPVAEPVTGPVAEPAELLAKSHEVPFAPVPSLAESPVVTMLTATDPRSLSENSKPLTASPSPPRGEGSIRIGSEPATSRAKIPESLEKPAENIVSTGSSLPRDRYLRKQERRRRLKEQRSQSRRHASTACR